MAQNLKDRRGANKQTTKGLAAVVIILIGVVTQLLSNVNIRWLLRYGLNFVYLLTLGMLLIGGLVGGILFAVIRKKKGESGTGEAPVHSRPGRNEKFSFDKDDHLHILPTDLSTRKRLEQLETLRGAGLYTREEYHVEKQRILNGGKS